MGLTLRSTGAGALDSGLEIKKRAESDLVIALATVFPGQFPVC